MIFLVRHGETALNVARIVQPPSTPLSDHGHAQAARLADRLARDGVAAILSSDLPRARQTAEAVARKTGLGIELTELLQERNFGDLRGRAYADLGVDIFAREYEPPGGESWAAFDARVGRAFSLALERAARVRGHLVVVTHGLVCRSLTQQFLALPQGVDAPQRWGNTSVTSYDAAAPHRVGVLNCVAHLEPGEDDAAAPSGL